MDIEIYQKLNSIMVPSKRIVFPYNIEFTLKEIELHSHTGKIFYEKKSNSSIKSKGGYSGGVRIYGY